MQEKKRRAALPIHLKRDQILDYLREHQVLVIVGETGSGKTTQLPQYCLEAGYGNKGKIAVTQPRRIAATSIAQRVAQERNVVLGSEVGYKIRFKEQQSKGTKIYFMTDGILLNETLKDRLLKQYEVIIIDEAHERSLNIDFLLGFLRQILSRRPELKLIISSATIDPSLFSQAFNNAPVIEVSGRLYPVDILYQPLDAEMVETGKFTYVDAAVQAVEELVGLGDPGDILVFLPSERDIHETLKLLKGRNLYNSICLPLFARLTRYQQNRIFQSSPKRKIIVATNIAETSITVPGIRFVVDTGVARISRYAPRLRTNRLPIEPISQASADQRMGRCGRIANGFCIRLYSEDDYQQRNKYNTPEIKRSNIAGVVLHMLHLRIGNIESFPFLEPPDKRSINDAFAQLRELNAINKNGELTGLGKKMARIPLEPHIARMVIQGFRENAQKEVVIIAAGLSIVDPRERPLEEKEKAELAQKQFIASGSDFLTLLRLWETYQNEWDTLGTQNKMRRFCKQHFLSYNRMQEWHDIHRQIKNILRECHYLKVNSHTAPLEAIHRSILSGLVANIAVKMEKYVYRATKNREVYIYPGSSLFKNSPEWIMSHEIFETSRVFARTVAPINPEWLVELAPNLCKSTFGEPYYDEVTMQVRAPETVTFFGLPIIKNRRTAFGKINPILATEVFIREALVKFNLRRTFRFLKHNRQVFAAIQTAQAKLRVNTVNMEGEDTAFEDFYRKRLSQVSSVHDLNRLIYKKGSDRFLFMNKNDILPPEIMATAETIPNTLNIGKKKFPLQYTYDPGAEDDGITVRVPSVEIPYIPEYLFTWLTPSLWEAKISFLLKNLPKAQRKKFLPITKYAKEIAATMQYQATPFSSGLSQTINSLYGLEFSPTHFPEHDLPNHLRMRIIIISEKEEVLAQSRDISELKNQYQTKKPAAKKSSYFHTLFSSAEIDQITDWDFPENALQVKTVKSANGFPVYGYPALVVHNSGIGLKFFPLQEEANQNHYLGVKKLIENHLSHEFAWLDRELKFSTSLQLACKPFGGEQTLRPVLFTLLQRHFLSIQGKIPYTKNEFLTLTKTIVGSIKGSGYQAVKILEQVLSTLLENDRFINSRATKQRINCKYDVVNELRKAQKEYMNALKQQHITYNQFQQYPRYMKAMKFRIEKAFSDPVIYYQRLEKIVPYHQKMVQFNRFLEKASPAEAALFNRFSLLVEEFYISLFAQHMKTIYPVSEKRLDKILKTIEQDKS